MHVGLSGLRPLVCHGLKSPSDRLTRTTRTEPHDSTETLTHDGTVTEPRARPQSRLWTYLPAATTHGPVSSVEPRALISCWRPVTDGWILLINHLREPPSHTYKRRWFRLTAARLAVGLAAWRKRSGDFCCALLEAMGRVRTWSAQSCTCGWARTVQRPPCKKRQYCYYVGCNI